MAKFSDVELAVFDKEGEAEEKWAQNHGKGKELESLLLCTS